MQISAATIEEPILFNVVKRVHDTLTTMVSMPTLPRSVITIYTIRKCHCVFSSKKCKLATAIIEIPTLFSITLKVCIIIR